MAQLVRNEDLRSLFLGAAAVAAIGLVGGALMHPTLAIGNDWPQGPQMAVGYGGERSDTETQTGATLTSYAGRTPDYVIGTDWLRPPQEQRADAIDARIDAMSREEVSAQAPVMAYAADNHASNAVEDRATPETALAVNYPSTSGGVPYESDLPRPPPPPSDEG